MLIGKGVTKTSLAVNITGSCVGVLHLKLIYERDGEVGVTCVFSSKTSEGKSDGKSKVTVTSKVVVFVPT